MEISYMKCFIYETFTYDKSIYETFTYDKSIYESFTYWNLETINANQKIYESKFLYYLHNMLQNRT